MTHLGRLLLPALMVAAMAAVPVRAPSADDAPSAALRAVVDGPQRSEKNRLRDPYRHPAETLAFFGLRDDMTVVEIWPGSAGYWTEILAPISGIMAPTMPPAARRARPRPSCRRTTRPSPPSSPPIPRSTAR